MGKIAGNRGAAAAKKASEGAANLRKLANAQPAPKSAASAAAKAMAGKGDTSLSVSVARQLAGGTDSDRAQLRAIVETLSPQAKQNLLTSIAAEMRDPQSPASAISLTPEGNALVGIIFRGEPPSAERLAEIARVGEGAAPRLADIPVGEDLSPKGPPQAPKGETKRKIQDQPRFRSNEKVVENKDGTLGVKHSSVTLDRDTARAIERAKKGEPVGPIYDDPTNAPYEGAPSGALRAGTRTPLQEYTQRLNRLAGLRDPSQGTHAGSVVSDEIGAEVPMSVFMPNIQSRPAGGSMATVRPQDYSDAMGLFQQVRRGENRVPNTQYNSPEEMARDLVAQAHQGGYNATPITASQRADATALVGDLADNPEDITPAAAGRTVRTYMPAEAKAASAAQRAVVQEQTIESLARKLQEVFGHEGWGADYTPSARPASADPAAPPAGVGEGVASSGYTPAGTEPRTRINPGREGMELDPELDMEDLADLDTRKRFAEPGGEEGQPLPGGEQESVLAPGAAHAREQKKLDVGPQQKVAGNAPGEYEDDASFAQHNQMNRAVSKGDLGRRQNFYDMWNKAVEMDSSPTSQLRRELDALVNSDEPIAPGTKVDQERLAKIADLQRRVALAERLDAMSGVKTFAAENPAASTPAASAGATPQGGALIPAPQKADPFDLNGKPHNPAEDIIDAEFEIKAPEANSPKADSPKADPAQKPKPSWWKRAAKVGAGLAGGLGIYEMLRRASEPPVPPGGYGDGTQGMNDPFGGGPGGPGGPVGPGGYPPLPPISGGSDMSPADRIRMLQRAGVPFNLNANTQTLQNWTQ